MPDFSEQIEQSVNDPQSFSADGQTVTDKPIGERIEADKYLAAKGSLAGTNCNGGPRSSWGSTRPASVVPPGGV